MPRGERGLQVVVGVELIRFVPEHLYITIAWAWEYGHVHVVRDCKHP